MASIVNDFPGTQRIHLALGARDLEASIAFYCVLFGIEPGKVRPGYALFTPGDPSINLSLNHEPAVTAGSAVQHFGIQVKSREAVASTVARLRAAGLPAQTEDAVTCCYAEQDKVWTVDPSGHRWEIFVTTDDRATLASANRQAAQSCCPGAGAGACKPS